MPVEKNSGEMSIEEKLELGTLYGDVVYSERDSSRLWRTLHIQLEGETGEEVITVPANGFQARTGNQVGLVFGKDCLLPFSRPRLVSILNLSTGYYYLFKKNHKDRLTLLLTMICMVLVIKGMYLGSCHQEWSLSETVKMTWPSLSKNNGAYIVDGTVFFMLCLALYPLYKMWIWKKLARFTNDSF
ncbi:hypothetical protein [Geomonas subterranea]|uniref:hypothetical protein n=1 Tax=Geomonas subterranea TaxID=2847989 RepID=UPI001CD6249B|nr:hypothetical protein [Geomonas fuzhouensis]